MATLKHMLAMKVFPYSLLQRKAPFCQTYAKEKEVSFSDLALHEERQLYTLDKYFQDEEAEPSYQQAGKKITPKLLLEAIRTLPEEKRKAIMLYYFEGMTDVEIGKLFNTSRSTIQYRRTSSFEILKKYLEEHADEWDEW